MYIFTTKPKYSVDTEEQIGQHKKFYGHRCDYCGAALWEQDYSPFCRYKLQYEDSDPCMGSSGDEYDFMTKHDVDVFQFLHHPYAFCSAPDYECEGQFLKWYVEQRMANTPGANHTLDGALREIRIKTATKLLEDGTIKAEDLKGND